MLVSRRGRRIPLSCAPLISLTTARRKEKFMVGVTVTSRIALRKLRRKKLSMPLKFYRRLNKKIPPRFLILSLLRPKKVCKERAYDPLCRSCGRRGRRTSCAPGLDFPLRLLKFAGKKNPARILERVNFLFLLPYFSTNLLPYLTGTQCLSLMSATFLTRRRYFSAVSGSVLSQVLTISIAIAEPIIFPPMQRTLESVCSRES